MNEAIRNLRPRAIWDNFANLNAVPRPSKKEARVIAFIKQFGEALNLETIVDAVGNVIIRKPAAQGMEDRKMVTLQSHLDMVHQKNNDTHFDFDKQGIAMYIDGDWVRAKGTTLGADNGLGVATIMALLQSTAIPHPPLEALFTIDEETGMTGAMGLKSGTLKGEILLNLDTEDDDEIGVGCAGGVDVTAVKKYTPAQADGAANTYKITLKGLRGGHSGMDIAKGLGNANKLMNRLLYKTRNVACLVVLNGGGLRNAIPRESVAFVNVLSNNENDFFTELRATEEKICEEFHNLEPALEITTEKVPQKNEQLPPQTQKQLFNVLYAAHNGVYRMNPDIENLVETSNNIAKVTVKDGDITIACLTRSSVASSKKDLATALQAAFELGGFTVSFGGEYPGWAPNMDSPILKILDTVYQKLNGEKPKIAACHAGLECGIFARHYPKMDMVSFGPTIKGAHSPDERASIASVQKYWAFVKEVLKHVPIK